jgi:hypothetical protein
VRHGATEVPVAVSLPERETYTVSAWAAPQIKIVQMATAIWTNAIWTKRYVHRDDFACIESPEKLDPACSSRGKNRLTRKLALCWYTNSIKAQQKPAE